MKESWHDVTRDFEIEMNPKFASSGVLLTLLGLVDSDCSEKGVLTLLPFF